MPAVGVGMALSSLVGRSIGAGDYATALRQVRVGAWITISYMSCMGLLFYVFRTPLVQFFSDDSAVVVIAAQLMITNGLCERGEFWWMARAINSFPVPLSPVISTVLSV